MRPGKLRRGCIQTAGVKLTALTTTDMSAGLSGSGIHPNETN